MLRPTCSEQEHLLRQAEPETQSGNIRKLIGYSRIRLQPKRSVNSRGTVSGCEATVFFRLPFCPSRKRTCSACVVDRNRILRIEILPSQHCGRRSCLSAFAPSTTCTRQVERCLFGYRTNYRVV